MDTQREFRWAIGALVALQVITSFGAIGLLGRMGPAIAGILNENVSTIEAAEEMLAAVALQREDPSGAERFHAALGRARDNANETEETVILDRIAAAMPAAFQGSDPAIQEIVENLRYLVRVNRDAMRRADTDARRLSGGGTWAAVLLALVSAGISLVIIRRFNTRVIAPIVVLHDTLEAMERGDPFRRCLAPRAGNDLRRVLGAVNRLLDASAAGRST